MRMTHDKWGADIAAQTPSLTLQVSATPTRSVSEDEAPLTIALTTRTDRKVLEEESC
jgi:hypothetical protein